MKLDFELAFLSQFQQQGGATYVIVMHMASFSFIYKEFLRDVSFHINFKIFKAFSQTFRFVRRLRRIFGRTDGLCDGKVKFGQIADLR